MINIAYFAVIESAVSPRNTPVSGQKPDQSSG
jgi:hypothetical protein